MQNLKTLCAGLALAAISQSPAAAFCGFFAGKADANLFNEASQVVMVRDGKRTVLSLQNDYNGPLKEFALIVPTPTTLEKGQVRIADRLTFERLDAYSSPRLAEYHDADPCRVRFDWGQEVLHKQGRDEFLARASAAAPSAAKERENALGVTVEARYTLGEYDIVSLSATQSDGLETWLRQNGYTIPRGASAALQPYINQGMKFFVAKVNLKEQARTGYTTLRPLQFAFESEKFMLPMRLGMLNAPPGKPQDLIVYLLTKEGRVESSNYRTAKLPANVNLPYFVRPKFQDFYKALFDNQARKEEHRVVFTEYFWDMAWCDPCAADPLRPDELQRAGVFWVGDGDSADKFRALAAPGGSATPPTSGPPPVARFGGDAQPVVLTRLHVRYTPSTFPEDLMFTETKDRQNWQTRYVVQNPYQGSVAQCSAQVGQMDCEALCKVRISSLLSTPPYQGQHPMYREKDPLLLARDCSAACIAAKQAGVEAASRYYGTDLPQRIAAEKQTLAQLTGWTLRDIDAMPDARRYVATGDTPLPSTVTPTARARPWWEALSNTSGQAR